MMGASKLLKSVFVLMHWLALSLSISIEDNAYKGIFIASSSGSWSDQNLSKLKEVLTKSSEYLFHATRNRSYFGEFVIADTWCHTPPTSHAPPRPRVDVYVTAEDSNTQTTLRTQHSKGCGEAGEIMYMPLGWLIQGNTEELAREFVQQWSIFRYGVFEEDPIDGRRASCYRSKDSWNPVGCYDRKKVAESSPDFQNGLPFCSIDSNDTTSFVQSKSSLMFTSHFSKALDFCDGSPSFPHDPAMPTLHNSLCKGETTWSVVQNSQDFKFGRNKPLMRPSPPLPTFAGFCQNNMQLTFAIQNNTSGKDLTEAVAEIGHFLYQFLLSLKDSSNVKPDVNFVMFSDEEDASAPLELDITSENLRNEIVDYVKTFRDVSTNCVSCGFRKALEASKEKSSSTIVVIAWEHTIGDEPPSELLKAIQQQQSPPRIIHLVLVENSEKADDVLTAELISAIRSTGGHIFFLPEKLVAMGSAIHAVLSTIAKSPLQVEDDDDVVHEAAFENIAGSFTDSFTTINPEKGTLEYLIHCHPLNRIVPSNMQNCIHTSSTIDTYKCVEELEPEKIKLWEFNHTDKGGTKPPNCSSVAILHNRLSTSKEKLTLKGWLSTYAIEPGSEALIVYAEIIGSSADYRVKAEISGPDDSLVSIELRDNGNGDPDVKQGDGIFSRYFMPPSLKKGSYGIKIFAESKSEITDKFYAHEPRKNVKIRRQSKSIGFFSVTKSFPEEDIFPPSRVGDLRALSYDRESSTVTLQWTAPGNDYDNGTADAYEVYLSEDWKDLQDEMLPKKPPNRLESLDTITLKASGEESRHTFQLPQQGNHSSTIYLALRSVDASQNKARMSNIVQIVDYLIERNETKDVTNDTDTTTEGELEIVEAANIHTCYYIIGGVCLVIVFIIILINVIVWIACFRKLKRNAKDYENMNNNETPAKKEIDSKENIVHAHSYANPVVSEYTQYTSTNAAGNDPLTQTSVLYTTVNKQRTRKPEEVRIPRHSERDLGLV